MSECSCNVSTGIDERITAGTGNLDRLGFWEFPCTHGKAERLERELARAPESVVERTEGR